MPYDQRGVSQAQSNAGKRRKEQDKLCGDFLAAMQHVRHDEDTAVIARALADRLKEIRK